jgi:hypothetical protein
MTNFKEIIIDQIANTLVKFDKSISEFKIKFTKHTATVYTNANSVLIKFGKFPKDEIVVHYHKWIDYLYKKIAKLLEQTNKSEKSSKLEIISKQVENNLDKNLDKVVDKVKNANNQENKVLSILHYLFGRK